MYDALTINGAAKLVWVVQLDMRFYGCLSHLYHHNKQRGGRGACNETLVAMVGSPASRPIKPVGK